MRQLTTTSRNELASLTKREQLVLLEIGGDTIDSASAFVGYISEAYGFSKSSVWYNLNRLKEKGVLDFATKEEPGRGLALTKYGLQERRGLERSGVRLETMEGIYAPAPNDPTPGFPVDLNRRNPLFIGSPILAGAFDYGLGGT